MIVKFQRNVFIDSEISSSGQKSKVNFPSSVFSIAPNENMRITLSSFEIRRSWYSINQTNNTFYLYDPAGAGSYSRVVIEAGTYSSFPDLVVALTAAVVVVVPGSSAAYDAIKRKFTITLGAAAPPGSYFVCFQVKLDNSFQPANVSNNGYFNDSQEILGAIPTRDGWNGVPVNAFRNTVALGPHISPFVGALNTLEAIYIRTNLHSGNYQTPGFDRGANSQILVPTEIFARIPLSRAYFDPEFEFVSFEDPNDLFSLLLNQTQLSQVYFSITDDKGRFIPQVSAGQAESGNLSFKMSFKYEVLVDDLPPDDRRLQIGNVSKQYENLSMV